MTVSSLGDTENLETDFSKVPKWVTEKDKMFSVEIFLLRLRKIPRNNHQKLNMKLIH